MSGGDSFNPLWIAPDQMGKELSFSPHPFFSPVYHLVQAPLQVPPRGLICTHMNTEELLELTFERSETLCTTVRHGL
jgi:hypothetical protein